MAKSFARIHRANLVSQGILPLVFADEADYERVSAGDEWRIEGVRDREELFAGDIRLRAELSAREREILLAGGLRNLLRSTSKPSRSTATAP